MAPPDLEIGGFEEAVLTAIHAPGGADARKALSSENCAKTLGAANVSDALRRFDSTQFKYFYEGYPAASRVGGGGLRMLDPDEVGFVSISRQMGKTIEFSGQIPWHGDLNSMTVKVVNESTLMAFPFRDATSQALEALLTDAQLRALMVLHEFGHVLGLEQETDWSYNKAIYRDCIRGVIQ